VKSFKDNLYEIIFEADTKAGKAFDVVLLIAILFSIFAVSLESVKEISFKYGKLLYAFEWIITILFTIEYILRVYIVNKAKTYIFSFFGIIDFLSILPSYIGLFLSGTHGLLVIRVLRLLRIFRVFKLSRYISEGNVLFKALNASRAKIAVFLYVVIMLVIIIGTIMYLIEGEQNGFTSIPQSIYWAIVTLTTVGYGDIAPVTTIGKFIASFVMIIGYGIIAVPTGIVSAEIAVISKKITTQVCPSCLKEGHDTDSTHCKFCGAKLNLD